MHKTAESNGIHSDFDEIDIKKEKFSIVPEATSQSLLKPQKYAPSKTPGCKLNICKGVVSLIFGLLFLSLGILTTIFSISKVIMDDRLDMTPGLPSFELWYKSEPIVYCRVYLFNFTNSEAFLSGTDSKLKIEEIGPINYREFIENSDVVHHPENSTMSYTIRRYIEFLPDMNEKDILNKTIIIPNIPLLTMAAIMDDYPFFLKIAFKVISRKDKLFLNTTIYNFLWNLTTPALQTASNIDKAKFMVPVDNSGVLENIYNYKNSIDRVNVKIGIKNGPRDFFKINNYNYRKSVPGYYPEKGDCNASLVDSTEGAIFGGEITKSDVFYYFRKAICRSAPLHFEKELQHGPFLAYKFIAKSNMYDRNRTNPETDCYRKYGKTIFPDGLSDASKCYADLPITVSLPHFYDRQSDLWNRKIEGFKPCKENHTSYTIIEPFTGTPLEQRARSQSNLILPSLDGFSPEMKRFSNTVIPMMWVEYHLKELTSSITAMVYISAKVLPVAQYVIPITFLLLGIALIYIGFSKFFFVNSSKKSAKLKAKEFF